MDNEQVAWKVLQMEMQMVGSQAAAIEMRQVEQTVEIQVGMMI